MSQAPRKKMPASKGYANDEIESRLKDELERDREEEKELEFALSEERNGAIYNLETSMTYARKLINSGRGQVEDIKKLNEHIRDFTTKTDEDFRKSYKGSNAAHRLKEKNKKKQHLREMGLERIPKVLPFDKPKYIMLLKFHENEAIPLRALSQPPYLRTTMQKLKQDSLVMAKFGRHLATNTLGLMKTLDRRLCYDPVAVTEEIYAAKKYMTNVTVYLWSVIGDDDMVKHLELDVEAVARLRKLGPDRFWEMLKVWVDWLNSGDGMGMIDNTPRVIGRPLAKGLKADLGVFTAALRMKGVFMFDVRAAAEDAGSEEKGAENVDGESTFGGAPVKAKPGPVTAKTGVARKEEIGAADLNRSAPKKAAGRGEKRSG